MILVICDGFARAGIFVHALEASFVWRLAFSCGIFVLSFTVTRLLTSWKSSCWSSAWLSTRASTRAGSGTSLGAWTGSLFRANDATFPAGTALRSLLSWQFELCRSEQHLVIGGDRSDWDLAWVNQTQPFLFLPDCFHFLIVLNQKLIHVFFLILMDVFPVLDAFCGPNLLLLRSYLFQKLFVNIHCILCNDRASFTTSGIVGLWDQVWNWELLLNKLARRRHNRYFFQQRIVHYNYAFVCF